MRVEWKESAVNRLAALFAAADPVDQTVIEATVERIGTQLSSDPWKPGESRGRRGRRVWFAHPLLVIYDIIPNDGIVLITQVGPVKSRGRG